MKNQEITITFSHLAEQLTDSITVNGLSMSDHIHKANVKAILPLMDRISKTRRAFSGIDIDSLAEGVRNGTTIADISEVCALFIGIGASMTSGSSDARRVTRKLVKVILRAKPHSMGLERVYDAAMRKSENDTIKGLISVTLAYGATLYMMNKRAQWNPLYWIHKLARRIKK